MQFSPRNSPGPTRVIVASFPFAEVTVTLSRPFCTKRIASAGSPCAKAVSFFFRLRILLPNPALARKALASKTVSPLVGFGLGVGSWTGFANLSEAGLADRTKSIDEIRLAGRSVPPDGVALALISHLQRAHIYTST